jgi:uncharacterized repeat protein (TIGR03803 family)
MDGTTPHAGLAQGTDGKFYGLTSKGGSGSGGTIFQVTSDGAETTLYSFCSEAQCADGENPYGAMLQGTNGIFYGVTYGGGDSTCNCGTVFSLNVGLAPFVSFVRGMAKPNQNFGIIGQGFAGATSVSVNGTPATFTVKTSNSIIATVPAGATTGYVTVTTPSGTLTSNVPFYVLP